MYRTCVQNVGKSGFTVICEGHIRDCITAFDAHNIPNTIVYIQFCADGYCRIYNNMERVV